MAYIYCTKKLEKLVGPKLMNPSRESGELGGWNGNIFLFQRRKCLILTNDRTYYSLFFIDIRKADILNLQALYYARLTEQLERDGIRLPHECAPKLMSELKPNFLPTNNNRSVLGVMNRSVQEVDIMIWHFYNDDLSAVNLPELNSKINDSLISPAGYKRRQYLRPVDEMKTWIDGLCRP